MAVITNPFIILSTICVGLHAIGMSYLLQRLKDSGDQTSRLWLFTPNMILRRYKQRLEKDTALRTLSVLRICCVVTAFVGVIWLASHNSIRSGANRTAPSWIVPQQNQAERERQDGAVEKNRPADAEYRTVFEIGIRSGPWLPVFIPIAITGIGFALIRYGRKNQVLQLIGGIAVIFSLFFLVLAGGTQVSQFVTDQLAYSRGNYSVIDGPVQDFHPMPYQGHEEESFSVGGIVFRYSDSVITPCFRNTASHGGPIHEGVYVRAYYRGDCSLRLDIRK